MRKKSSAAKLKALPLPIPPAPKAELKAVGFISMPALVLNGFILTDDAAKDQSALLQNFQTLIEARIRSAIDSFLPSASGMGIRVTRVDVSTTSSYDRMPEKGAARGKRG